jgi:glycosyltransferase involved in cell wall biosynthesis
MPSRQARSSWRFRPGKRKRRSTRGINGSISIDGGATNTLTLSALRNLSQSDILLANLPALYRHAALLAWVSLYEGFGMPPLEAGACGTPVIASNVSCFPEVLDDDAILVPPLDAHAIATAITSLATDPARRAEMAARARARAARFSWAEAARRTLEVYLSVAQ